MLEAVQLHAPTSRRHLKMHEVRPPRDGGRAGRSVRNVMGSLKNREKRDGQSQSQGRKPAAIGAGNLASEAVEQLVSYVKK